VSRSKRVCHIVLSDIDSMILTYGELHSIFLVHWNCLGIQSIVPIALKFVLLNSIILENFDNNFILFRIFLYAVSLYSEHRNSLESYLEVPESTLFCIQPVWEHLKVPERVSKAV
jgi:hypothetical protein